MAAELVLLMGLPASGKSTFYRERFARSHALVSKDLMPNNRNRERRQRELVREALLAGASVVVDNTNPAARDRSALIEIAKALGASVIGYYFEPDPKACVARNEKREGRAKVPPVAIFACLKRLEEPSFAEGFSRLYRVSMLSGGGFEVTEQRA